MSQTSLIWLEFGVCAVLITLAGWRLSLYGDVIAEETGLGRTWIGVLLLGLIGFSLLLVQKLDGLLLAHVGIYSPVSVLLLWVYLANAYVLLRFGG